MRFASRKSGAVSRVVLLALVSLVASSCSPALNESKHGANSFFQLKVDGDSETVRQRVVSKLEFSCPNQAFESLCDTLLSNNEAEVLTDDLFNLLKNEGLVSLNSLPDATYSNLQFMSHEGSYKCTKHLQQESRLVVSMDAVQSAIEKGANMVRSERFYIDIDVERRTMFFGFTPFKLRCHYHDIILEGRRGLIDVLVEESGPRSKASERKIGGLHLCKENGRMYILDGSGRENGYGTGSYERELHVFYRNKKYLLSSKGGADDLGVRRWSDSQPENIGNETATGSQVSILEVSKNQESIIFNPGVQGDRCEAL